MSKLLCHTIAILLNENRTCDDKIQIVCKYFDEDFFLCVCHQIAFAVYKKKTKFIVFCIKPFFFCCCDTTQREKIE